MKFNRYLFGFYLGFSLLGSSLDAQQQPASAPIAATVPRLVNFSGKTADAQGKPIAGIAGVTLAIYKDQYEAAPLWLETQNIQADTKGNYTVQLGATKPNGLPLDLFSSGDARWLGVTVNGGQEQPRVLLLSVPYALKAADAETIGGLPPSAFMLAAPPIGNSASLNGTIATTAASVPPPATLDVTTTGGTVNAIPLFNAAGSIQNSILTQTGTTAVNIGGKLNLPATGAATALAGKNSRPETMVASSFSSSTGTAVNQTFQWQAEPLNNNTTTPSGTLNLLYGLGATTPSETGLKLSPTGVFTFAAGQTFPGTGTISGITTASGSGLAGGGTSGTLNLSVPAGGVTNAMLQNSKITLNASTGGGLTVPGAMTLGDTSTIGLQTCAPNQVLQYISGAWSCSTLATGSVTNVALSAPSSDFTVSGSPVTGAGTLGLNWNVAPTTTNTANAIVKRDGTGSFSAGSISSVTLTASNPAGLAIRGSTAAPSAAVAGVNSGTSAAADGVDGVSASAFAAGVAGVNTNFGYGVYGDGGIDSFGGGGTGVYGTGSTGVYGVTSAGIAGTLGQYGTKSGVGRQNGNYAGAWGDGGTAGSYGVLGTTDDGNAGFFLNSSRVSPTLYAFNFDSSGLPFQARNVSNNTGCNIDAGGNLNCTGSKNAVVPLDGGKRTVALSAIESPENWFEDFGSAQLADGVAVIPLDPDFIQTVNTEKDYRVFPVPNGDCRGLYVTNKSANSFEVHELGGGTSNVRFDYRITAIRRKYETVRFADHTNDPDPRKMLEQMRKAKPASSSDPVAVKPTSINQILR
jgi:hypothetical protein